MPINAADDVAAAVVALWKTPPAQQTAWPQVVQTALAALQKAIPNGPLQLPLPTGQPDAWVELTVAAEPARPRDSMTGRVDPVSGLHVTVYIDYRRVELRAVGKKALVSPILDNMANVYNLNLGQPGYPALILPSGFRTMQWLPTAKIGPVDAKEKKKGEDFFEAHLEAEVWSVRND